MPQTSTPTNVRIVTAYELSEALATLQRVIRKNEKDIFSLQEFKTAYQKGNTKRCLEFFTDEFYSALDRYLQTMNDSWDQNRQSLLLPKAEAREKLVLLEIDCPEVIRFFTLLSAKKLESNKPLNDNELQHVSNLAALDRLKADTLQVKEVTATPNSIEEVKNIYSEITKKSLINPTIQELENFLVSEEALSYSVIELNFEPNQKIIFDKNKIILENISHLSNDIVNVLEQFPRVKQCTELTIENSSALKDALPFLKKATEVKQLTFANFNADSFVLNTHLPILVRYYSQLEELAITVDPKILGYGFFNMIEETKSLQNIDLSKCTTGIWLNNVVTSIVDTIIKNQLSTRLQLPKETLAVQEQKLKELSDYYHARARIAAAEAQPLPVSIEVSEPQNENDESEESEEFSEDMSDDINEGDEKFTLEDVLDHYEQFFKPAEIQKGVPSSIHVSKSQQQNNRPDEFLKENVQLSWWRAAIIWISSFFRYIASLFKNSASEKNSSEENKEDSQKIFNEKLNDIFEPAPFRTVELTEFNNGSGKPPVPSMTKYLLNPKGEKIGPAPSSLKEFIPPSSSPTTPSL